MASADDRTKARRAPANQPSLEGYRIDDQIGHQLRRAYQAASAHLAARIKPFDLTPQQFATLAKLWERGPLPQSQLGREVDTPRANIHIMIDRLRKRGLVTTARDKADRRVVHVALTSQGHALIENLIPLDMAATTDASATLTPSEARTLAKLLAKLT